MALVLFPACTSCAKAKRRCCRRRPSCSRCSLKNVECSYPSSQPASVIIFDEQGGNSSTTTTFIATTFIRSDEHGSPVIRSDPLSSLTVAADASTIDPPAWWFATSSTWIIEGVPERVIMRPRSADELQWTITTIQCWLTQWVNKGSNTFIHDQLYRHSYPSCMQDAFMAAACYLQRQSCNEYMLARVISDKALHTVGQIRAYLTWSEKDFISVNMIQLLSLAQALLIHQILGLLHSEKNLSLELEDSMESLREYMSRCIASASRMHPLGKCLVTPSDRSDLPWAQLTWNSWVVAESLRRTYLVMSVVHSIYLASRYSIARCFGGMMITCRREFWEASSAFLWQEHCMQTFGTFIHVTEGEVILPLMDPTTVDELAAFIFTIIFGSNQTVGDSNDGVQACAILNDPYTTPYSSFSSSSGYNRVQSSETMGRDEHDPSWVF